MGNILPVSFSDGSSTGTKNWLVQALNQVLLEAETLHAAKDNKVSFYGPC